MYDFGRCLSQRRASIHNLLGFANALGQCSKHDLEPEVHSINFVNHINDSLCLIQLRTKLTIT